MSLAVQWHRLAHSVHEEHQEGVKERKGDVVMVVVNVPTDATPQISMTLVLSARAKADPGAVLGCDV